MRNNLVVPRNGVSLQVLIVARISGCASQKEISIEDQIDNCKAEIKSMVDDNMIVNYETIQSKDKGEALDRKELTQLSDIVATNTIDIVICEDLGRIIRGAEANALAGKMCDHKTRLIAINDDIDTSYENWEEDVLSACRDHVGHNSHTSKRLKKKLMTRFERSGAARADLPYGYLPYSKGDSYYDIKKDPEAEIYIRKGYELLASSLSSSLVAKYFNEHKVPTGPYMTRTKWDRRSVLRLFRNPILKGHPCRGATKSIKHHQTGRRISVKNPEGRKFIDCPHLAYLTEIEFDSLQAAFAHKNRNCAHKKVNGRQ